MYWQSSRFPVHLTYFASVFHIQTVYVSDVLPVDFFLKISMKNLTLNKISNTLRKNKNMLEEKKSYATPNFFSSRMTFFFFSHELKRHPATDFFSCSIELILNSSLLN
jgi:hypothetical protein